MDLGIQGKCALMFGGGGGLGSAIAQQLASEGAHVVVADINFEAAAATQSAIKKQGGNAFAIARDLADTKIIPERIEHIRQAYGDVSILLNNTGAPPPTPISGQSLESWGKYFDEMMKSVIAVTDAILPGMRAAKWGRIITSSSSGTIAPIANLGLSNTLRAVLVGWSKTLAREVVRDCITANIVVPGRIATNRILFLDEQKAKRENRPVADIINESTGSIPVERYGEPKEYAAAVAFLASKRASYITGSILRVDGGLIPSI